MFVQKLRQERIPSVAVDGRCGIGHVQHVRSLPEGSAASFRVHQPPTVGNAREELVMGIVMVSDIGAAHGNFLRGDVSENYNIRILRADSLQQFWCCVTHFHIQHQKIPFGKLVGNRRRQRRIQIVVGKTRIFFSRNSRLRCSKKQQQRSNDQCENSGSTPAHLHIFP